MIGNAISPHIVKLIKGIYRASADMQINVFFFLESTADIIITSAKNVQLIKILIISKRSMMFSAMQKVILP